MRSWAGGASAYFWRSVSHASVTASSFLPVSCQGEGTGGEQEAGQQLARPQCAGMGFFRPGHFESQSLF